MVFVYIGVGHDTLTLGARRIGSSYKCCTAPFNFLIERAASGKYHFEFLAFLFQTTTSLNPT